MSYGTIDPLAERLARELGFSYDDVGRALAVLAGAGADAELAEGILRGANKRGARYATNAAELWAVQNAGKR